jgi:hypothetical protein
MNIRQGGVTGRIHLEVAFRSIADKDLEEFVRGVENTAWWLPEMDQAPDGLVSLLQNRVGRYPEPDDRPDPSLGLGDTYEGVFGDANAPVVGGWFHNRFYIAAKAKKPIKLEDGREIIDRVFFQPPGILADGSPTPTPRTCTTCARSRPTTTPKAATMDDYDINRLLNNPGWSRYGKPVHRTSTTCARQRGPDRARRQPGAAHRRRLRQHAEAGGDLFAAVLLQPAPGHGRNLAGGPADGPGRVLRRDPQAEGHPFPARQARLHRRRPLGGGQDDENRQISYAQKSRA